MKRILFGLLSISFIFAVSPVSSFAASADNVYLSPLNAQKSDIVMSDWSAVQSTPYTYWATQNWNQGAEGGGYAGFQQDASSSWAPRRLHIGIWDPMSSNLPLTAQYIMPGAKAEKFGGEGTGMKVMTPYSWVNQNWYRMVVRTWDNKNNGTSFGQWIKDVANNKWNLVAVVNHPVKGVRFVHGFGSFQEDWGGTAQNVREARIKNGYNRTVGGTWVSWKTQKISSNNSLRNWDGGANSDYFWFKAGGSTKPSISNGVQKSISQPAMPEFDNILLENCSASYANGNVNVKWQMKSESSPQFGYKVEIYDNSSLTGTPIAAVSETKPEAVTILLPASLQNGKTYYAKISVTDIFDRTAFSTASFIIDGATPHNIALGKTITTSIKFSNIKFINDGIKNNTTRYADDYPNGNGLQWIQFDLGKVYSIKGINIWHYWGNERTYKDVSVRLSNRVDFLNDVKTVFNNDVDNSAGFGMGTDEEYQETSEGKTIRFNPESYRYVRLYSNGNTRNANNHYVEVEIIGE